MSWTASSHAQRIRRMLKEGGSPEHGLGVQRYFKEEIRSWGWYTKDLRQLAQRERRAILAERTLDGLIALADQLFQGSFLEEKVVAVSLLEKSVDDLV